MEQINELFEILKSTPELAVWGLTIWCLYVLLKLSSVVYALKIVASKAVDKVHDYKVKKLNLDSVSVREEFNKREKELNDKESAISLEKRRVSLALEIMGFFERNSIDSSVNPEDLKRLLDAVKGEKAYIRRDDVNSAIDKITKK